MPTVFMRQVLANFAGDRERHSTGDGSQGGLCYALPNGDRAWSPVKIRGRKSSMNSVDRILRTVVVMLLAALPFAGQVRAQASPNEKLYVVSHVDLVPTFAVEGTKLLQQYVVDTHKDPGIVRVELLQDNARTNHYTVVAVWENTKSFEAHEGTEHAKRFREKIQPMLGSPFDERLHRMMD